MRIVFVKMRSGLRWTSPEKCGNVEIMPDKVILDHKKSYLVSFENFHFFQFLAKIGNKCNLHFRSLSLRFL